MFNKFAQILTFSLVLAIVVSSVVPVGVLAQTALVANITAPANNSTVTVGQVVNFTATASGGTSPYAFVWDFGAGLTGSISQNPSQTFTTAGARTITLVVTDINDVSVTQTINLTVADTSNPTLAISNIRIENVTTSGATLKWTTNLPSTSRVIYDTQSHSTLGTAPNYDYANSTATSDTATKVTEHTVTLSGLSANTQYFFRVISEE
ncbi:MAG: PKD domain-containing protein [Candidatus Vogelbacteria bacterium]|nr:PKD domain-containing protein [Candidatus Vogelbacteria bacterium]